MDKRDKEIHRLQKEVKDSQESLSNEHALSLRLQKELKESGYKYETLNEQRRTLEAENAQLKATLESCRTELAQLKKENAEFRKQKEDTAWVAKSDYALLEQRLREKESQLKRLERNSSTPPDNLSKNA